LFKPAFPSRLESLEDRLLLTVDFTDLVRGLSSQLGILDSINRAVGIVNDASGRLPVLKTPLRSISAVNQAVQDFKNRLTATLSEPANQSDDAHLRSALFQALGSGPDAPSGLGILADANGDGQITPADITVTPFNAASNQVTISMHLKKTIAVDAPFDFGLGLPGGFPLRFSTQGMLHLQVGFDYANFSFGIRNPVYFTNPGTFKLTLDVGFAQPNAAQGIPSTELTGTIGFLQCTATDGTDSGRQHTNFHGDFAFSVGSSGISNARLNGQADIHLNLRAMIPGPNGNNFPSVGADFNMVWPFTDADPTGFLGDFGAAPVVTFDHVKFYLGDFLTHFVSPVIKVVQPLTKPFQPIFDALVTPLPGLSDLGFGDVTLLRLAGLSAGSYPPEIARALRLATILVQVVDDIDHFAPGIDRNFAVDFGSFDLRGNNPDLRTLPQSLNTAGPDFTSLTPNPVGGIIEGGLSKLEKTTGAFHDVAQHARDALKGLQDGIKLDFPIFTDPLHSLFKLLIGQQADIVTLSGQYSFQADQRLGLNFYGAEIGLRGAIDGDASFRIAYDTYGLRDFITHALNHQVVPVDFLKGFYFDTSTHVTLGGSLTAYAGVNLAGVFSAEIHGGITTGSNGITLRLPDPQHNGHLRLADIPTSDCLMTADGELDAALFAEVKIGADLPLLGFVGVKHTFPLKQHTLLDLNHLCIPNPFAQPRDFHLASLDPRTGTLTLNLGADSAARTYVDEHGTMRLYEPNAGNEVYTISHVSGSPTDPAGETVQVMAFGFTQQIDHVQRIYAHGGSADLSVTINAGVHAGAQLYGGSGKSKLIYSGDGDAVIFGGSGANELAGGAGTNNIYGGPGTAQITGGSGTNFLYGARGDSQITGGTGRNYIFGGTGHDVLNAGPGRSDVRAGGTEATLIAGPTGSALYGGPGSNTYVPGPGSDDLYLGTGLNVITWSVQDGNTLVHGGGSRAPHHNILQVIGSTDHGDVMEVGRFGSGVKVDVPSSSRTVAAYGVQDIDIEAGPKSNHITVDDLNDTAVQQVGINLGTVTYPSRLGNTIDVYGHNADTLTVAKQSAYTRQPGDPARAQVADHVTEIDGFHNYSVAAANFGDSLTLHTGAGNNTINVQSISGRTWIKGGPGDDTFNVTSASPEDFVMPLDIDAGGGKNTLKVDVSQDRHKQNLTVSDHEIAGWVYPDGPVRKPFSVTYQATGGNFGGGVTLTTGAVTGDTVDVSSTRADAPTTVNTAGRNTITAGAEATAFSAIRGPLTVHGGGTDDLTVNDKAANVRRRYTVYADRVVADGRNLLSYSTVGSLSLHVPGVDNTFNVEGTPAGTAVTLDEGTNHDTVNIGTPAGGLDGLFGPVTVTGLRGGGGIVNVNDQGTTGSRDYTLAAHSLSKGRSTQPLLTCTDVGRLVFDEAGGGQVHVASTPAIPAVDLNAHGGWSPLYGPDVDNVWRFADPTGHTGTLNDTIKFTGMSELWGGSGADRFVFGDGGRISAHVFGRGGSNTLDYSAYTTRVEVNLGTGSATGIAGGVLHAVGQIDTVIGGQGDNLLVGGWTKSTLKGGKGRDVLIGGTGDAQLVAGSGEAILIGGSTAYDSDARALAAIMAEWTRRDGTTYQQRVDHVMSGRNGLNGTVHLDKSTVTANPNDVLTGGQGLDFVIRHHLARLTTAQRPGEVILSL
jgi:Ca2+-binding RTX toxin-like protein